MCYGARMNMILHLLSIVGVSALLAIWGGVAITWVAGSKPDPFELPVTHETQLRPRA
jgi:hypothetical protein